MSEAQVDLSPLPPVPSPATAPAARRAGAAPERRGAPVRTAARNPGRAWMETASNLVEESRRAARRERTERQEQDERDELGADGEGALRSLAVARMVETFGEKMELPYHAEHALWKKVIGPAVDMHETLVRRLIVDGFPIHLAGTVADMAEAAYMARHRPNGKLKRGRMTLGPRLWVKNRKKDKKDEDGAVRRFVYIKHLGKRESARIELREGEDVRFHLGALYALAEFVEERVREALGYVLTRDVNMTRVYDEYLDENAPGKHAEALDADLHKRAKAALDLVAAYNGTFAFDRIGINAARQYSAHRTAQEKQRQSCDAEETEYVSSSTARTEADFMIMAVNWFTAKYQLPAKNIERPKVRGTGYKYIPLAYVLRLLRACRGRVFDAAGRVIGCHRFPERYACVERFIWLYFYSGTRHGNLPELLWHWDPTAGHISTWLKRIMRQGQWSEVTTKRRGQSDFNGSLDDLAPKWEAADREKRREAKSDVLYTHVLHDENGEPLAEGRIGDLFREVRELAGLKFVTPHMLKHSGVTTLTHAGMDRASISFAFSTHPDTLQKYYTHLNEEWSSPRVLDPGDLQFHRLRRFSERPMRPLAHAA
ncbi:MULTISPECIES: hypothetical protein [Bradyrhizobium]|uniref:hypothetical protein n=1 Tax=Bradyrhizobium TaxID=374 RepID=UPI00195C9D8E|nr:hypothetical protein [Bradyrhizobium canariense]MBM7486104.1 hypothetical protein [Bradyrhizobium canariense]